MCNISKFWNCIILFSYEGIVLDLRMYGFELLNYIFHLFQCLWCLYIKLSCMWVKVMLKSQTIFTWILCWFFWPGWSYKEIHSKTCLGTFANLRKDCEKRLLASSCLSICLSAWNDSAPTGRIFMAICIWVFFENMSRKFTFHYNRTRITGNVHED